MKKATVRIAPDAEKAANVVLVTRNSGRSWTFEPTKAGPGCLFISDRITMARTYSAVLKLGPDGKVATVCDNVRGALDERMDSQFIYQYVGMNGLAKYWFPGRTLAQAITEAVRAAACNGVELVVEQCPLHI